MGLILEVSVKFKGAEEGQSIITGHTEETRRRLREKDARVLWVINEDWGGSKDGEHTVTCPMTTQGLSFKGDGKETSTHQFPESAPLAKTSKGKRQGSFLTSLEILWPCSDGGFTWSSVRETGLLFS